MNNTRCGRDKPSEISVSRADRDEASLVGVRPPPPPGTTDAGTPTSNASPGLNVPHLNCTLHVLVMSFMAT